VGTDAVVFIVVVADGVGDAGMVVVVVDVDAMVLVAVVVVVVVGSLLVVVEVVVSSAVGGEPAKAAATPTENRRTAPAPAIRFLSGMKPIIFCGSRACTSGHPRLTTMNDGHAADRVATCRSRGCRSEDVAVAHRRCSTERRRVACLPCTFAARLSSDSAIHSSSGSS
jgi:hypothetical protein